MMTAQDNAGEWYIAGHNGLMIPGSDEVDEYAKKNLRTVSIDLDEHGKYVEFEVHKRSAKELCDRLNADHNAALRVQELERALGGLMAGGYFNDCTCGHCQEIRRVAIAALSTPSAEVETA